MVLCICRSVSEREIEAAIRSGAHSLDEVASACGAGTDCGICQGEIEARIEGAGPCGGGCADCPRKGAGLVSPGH